MSDETTPGLREQIASRLSQVWPYEIHLNVENNTNKIRGAADVVMDVVQPEIDRLRERAESAEGLAASAIETVGRLQRDERTTEQLRKQQEERAEQAESELAAAEDLADRRLQDHRAEIAEAEAQIRTAEATVARVQALAEDMRTWCSPHGIAVTYAQRIEEAVNPPELAAVRDFAANLDPREETS